MKPVTIVGAGFSGLTLAYYLRHEGIPVEIFERQARTGGLISSRREALGLVETAANALLVDKNVEDLFADLDIKFASRLKTRHRRYIFWRRPSRWPLSLWTSLKLLKLKFASPTPRAQETVAAWAKRLINEEFLERLLAPALRGVYAGNPERLSAKLILGSVFGGGVERGKFKGSMAPQEGMGQLIHKLEEKLIQDGVTFHFSREFKIGEMPTHPTVICTSAWAAAEVVGTVAPEWKSQLEKCEALPLITVTAFFPSSMGDLQGFGCLFPEGQGFQALGVLFNASIFEGRSERRSETWIFGGAGGEDVLKFSDEQIRESILKDRARLPGGTAAPAPAGEVQMHITRWPKALPHYTVEWERRLLAIPPKSPLYLHGNYLGGLGLARILARSKKLAHEIRDQYVRA